MTSWLARRCLKSPASRVFTPPFVQAQIKENINAPRHWPLWGEFTGHRWIPCTKGQKTRKMFPFNDVIVHPLCATGLGWPFTLQEYTCVKWTLYYSHWSNTSVHTCHISLYFVIEKVAFFWPKVCWSKRSFNTYLWYVGNSNDLVLLLTHPAGAQIGTFCVIWVKTIVAGALTPCVATSSTAML